MRISRINNLESFFMEGDDSIRYRSDVRIITSKKSFDELKRIIDKILKDKNIKYGNLMDDCNIIYNNGSKYFRWAFIKWHDGIE